MNRDKRLPVLLRGNKHLLISAILFAAVSIFTLNSDKILGFQTEFPFGWENLGMGLMCFPVFMPIGLQTIASLALLSGALFGFYAMCLKSVQEKSMFSSIKWVGKFFVFLFLVAVCDYCYWDIGGAQVVPNLNYEYAYQQYNHAEIAFNQYKGLSWYLIAANIISYLYLLFDDRLSKLKNS